MKREIDKKEDTTYKDCNYFVSRRFKKRKRLKAMKASQRRYIIFADFRLEFVEENLNDPKFNNPGADKIHVEIVDYKDYVYVVVGITSSWYEKKQKLLN